VEAATGNAKLFKDEYLGLSTKLRVYSRKDMKVQAA
jgi:hypothetical protein